MQAGRAPFLPARHGSCASHLGAGRSLVASAAASAHRVSISVCEGWRGSDSESEPGGGESEPRGLCAALGLASDVNSSLSALQCSGILP